MSILTQKQILERVKSGSIGIDPALDEYQVQAHAIDLRLGYTFMIPRQWIITEKGRESLSLDHLDPQSRNHFEIIELEKTQFFELLPHEYVLASTLESVKLPDDLMSVLYPRSSTNRRGLSVDLTGIIDSGYEGQLIIPIRNNTQSQVVRLYPGERFCQITFEQLSESSLKAPGKYQNKDVIEGFIKNYGDARDDSENEELEYIRKGLIPELKKEKNVK